MDVDRPLLDGHLAHRDILRALSADTSAEESIMWLIRQTVSERPANKRSWALLQYVFRNMHQLDHLDNEQKVRVSEYALGALLPCGVVGGDYTGQFLQLALILVIIKDARPGANFGVLRARPYESFINFRDIRGVKDCKTQVKVCQMAIAVCAQDEWFRDQRELIEQTRAYELLAGDGARMQLEGLTAFEDYLLLSRLQNDARFSAAMQHNDAVWGVVRRSLGGWLAEHGAFDDTTFLRKHMRNAVVIRRMLDVHCKSYPLLFKICCVLEGCIGADDIATFFHQLISTRKNSAYRRQLMLILRFFLQAESWDSVRAILHQVTLHHDSMVVYTMQDQLADELRPAGKNVSLFAVGCGDINQTIFWVYIQFMLGITDSAAKQLLGGLCCAPLRLSLLNVERVIVMKLRAGQRLDYNLLRQSINCQDYAGIRRMLLKVGQTIDAADFVQDNFDSLQFLYEYCSLEQLYTLILWAEHGYCVTFATLMRRLLSDPKCSTAMREELFAYTVANIGRHITLNIDLQMGYAGQIRLLATLARDLGRCVTVNQLCGDFQLVPDIPITWDNVGRLALIHDNKNNEPDTYVTLQLVFPAVFGSMLAQVQSQDHACLLLELAMQYFPDMSLLTQFMAQRPNAEMQRDDIIIRRLISRDHDFVQHVMGALSGLDASNLGSMYSAVPTQDSPMLCEEDPRSQFYLAQLLQSIKIITQALTGAQLLGLLGAAGRQDDVVRLQQMFIVHCTKVNSMPTQEQLLLTIFDRSGNTLLSEPAMQLALHKLCDEVLDIIRAGESGGFAVRRRSQNVRSVFEQMYEHLAPDRRHAIDQRVVGQVERAMSSGVAVAQSLNILEACGGALSVDRLTLLLDSGLADAESYDVANAVRGVLRRFGFLLVDNPHQVRLSDGELERLAANADCGPQALMAKLSVLKRCDLGQNSVAALRRLDTFVSRVAADRCPPGPLEPAAFAAYRNAQFRIIGGQVRRLYAPLLQ